jgi:hypothetical protein
MLPAEQNPLPLQRFTTFSLADQTIRLLLTVHCSWEST